MPEAAKATLREAAARLDPIQLLEQIRAAYHGHGRSHEARGLLNGRAGWL